jgi:hypothetical protein
MNAIDSPPWPEAAAEHLQPNARGWHTPTPAFWRVFWGRPELALVPESCPAEIALSERLQADPLALVSEAEVSALADADARDNWRVALAWRETVLASGTLEAAWLAVVRGERPVPAPLFLDLAVQAILARILPPDHAMLWRAAELLCRPQRISLNAGRVLAADAAVADTLQDTAGLGDMGRLLREAGASLPEQALPVLGTDTAADYLAQRASHRAHRHVLDLTLDVQQHLPHGLTLTLQRADSGLKALSVVLSLWLQHLLGLRAQIEPLPRIDDERWRWHIGLDTEASAILNALYQGETLAPQRLERLIGLFRLRLDDAVMAPDVRGKPVYLGLAMDAQGRLKLKPQNLVLNLPLV